MKKSTSVLLLCSSLLGCSVIHGGEFTQDRACDLELKVRGFSPHVVDVTHVFLTRANLDGTQRRNEAVAVFDPLGTPNLDLRMPGSVRPRTNANLGLPSIDFFADFDDMEGFSAGDHTWTLDDACTTGPEEFPHNTDFTPIREPVVSGAAVNVTFCELPLALRRSAVEVRVTRVLPDETNDMEVVNQAVGFYRLDDASRRPGGITIPPVANLDFDLIVEVIADLNGNGVLERTELAWSYEHDGDAHVPCDMVPILDDSGCPSVPMVPARMPACVEGGNLRIIVAGAFMRNEESTLQSDVPWFRRVTP